MRNWKFNHIDFSTYPAYLEKDLGVFWSPEKTVIKIFDSESNELIRQFPSEEILSIAQRIIDLQHDISQKTGILLDENI